MVSGPKADFEAVKPALDIIGKVFDSNGATLLGSVTAFTTDITSGGVAFRATGSDKFWDTVTVIHGVNNFAQPAARAPTPTACPSPVWRRAWRRTASCCCARRR